MITPYPNVIREQKLHRIQVPSDIFFGEEDAFKRALICGIKPDNEMNPTKG
jgi:hypothetical protein